MGCLVLRSRELAWPRVSLGYLSLGLLDLGWQVLASAGHCWAFLLWVGQGLAGLPLEALAGQGFHGLVSARLQGCDGLSLNCALAGMVCIWWDGRRL